MVAADRSLCKTQTSLCRVIEPIQENQKLLQGLYSKWKPETTRWSVMPVSSQTSWASLVRCKTHIQKTQRRKSNGPFLFFYQGRVYSYCLNQTMAFWAVCLTVLFVPFRWCLRLFYFLIVSDTWFCSLSVFTWLCTGLLIVLISCVGAVYLQ